MTVVVRPRLRRIMLRAVLRLLVRDCRRVSNLTRRCRLRRPAGLLSRTTGALRVR